MCNLDVTNTVLGKKKANTQDVLPPWIEMGKGNPRCQRSEKGKLSEGMAWQEKSLRGAPGVPNVWCLDLSTGYTGVFTLCKAIEWHANDL